jgi:hypothetical protein
MGVTSRKSFFSRASNIILAWPSLQHTEVRLRHNPGQFELTLKYTHNFQERLLFFEKGKISIVFIEFAVNTIMWTIPVMFIELRESGLFSKKGKRGVTIFLFR